MYYHRTYIEKSDDFNKMCLLVSYLNSLHLCDWSLGRLFGWKYGRWSKESQIDSLFEKQSELFFDDFYELCGIIITENFGESYYILSKKDKELLQSMTDFLLEGGNFNNSYAITVPVNDEYQKEVLERNGFICSGDADVTCTYNLGDIVIPNIVIPNEFVLTSQREYLDEEKAELLRFYAFNPNGIYDEILDNAYKYARKNPILVPELCILLLNENGEPISTCTGLLDKNNQFIEVEVVATKKEYENRGFAKIVISECIKRGISKGVKEFSISAWEEKTRILYSSFGKSQSLKKVKYKRNVS
jgi:hypothetical protein